MAFLPIPDGTGPGGIFIDGDQWITTTGDIVRDDFTNHEARIDALALNYGKVLLATRTAAASATLDFTSVLSSLYNEYEFVYDSMTPDTDNAQLQMMFSKNNGGLWLNSLYTYSGYVVKSGVSLGTGSNSTSHFPPGVGVSLTNVTARGGLSGTAVLLNANSTTQWHHMISSCWGAGADNNYYNINGSGSLQNSGSAAINAVRFLMSAGSITSGVVRCYGYKK